MSAAKDLSGQTFDKIEVVKFTESKFYGGRKRRFYACVCHHCGKDCEVPGDHLTRNQISSCGCLRRRTGSENPKWRGYGEISGELWDNIKRKDRGFDFSITIDYAWSLFESQKRKCSLSGLDLVFGAKRTASLDRINSDIGYVPGNIQWVHKDINIMKNDFDQKWFIEVCKNITEYQAEKECQVSLSSLAAA